MADFDFLNYEEYENWLALVVGLAATVDGLQDYCKDRLDFIQFTINTIVSNRKLPTCVNNCSKNEHPNGKDWCNTCFTWRKQLKIFSKDKRQWNGIIWSKINSKDWGTKYQEIAKTFMKLVPDNQSPLEDLGALMSLFRNCVEFRLAEQHIVNVSIVRNRYFAHCLKLSLTLFEKQQCLNILKALLKVEQVAATKSAQKAIFTIDYLKATDHISKNIIDKKTRSKFVSLANSKIDDVCKHKKLHHKDKISISRENDNDVEYLRKRVRDFNTIQNKRSRLTMLCSRLTGSRIFLLVLILLYTYILLPHDRNNQLKDYIKGKKSECLSLYFNEFGGSDWDFLYEMRTLFNSSVIERTWLKDVIQRELNKTDKGLLLTSDMGFGKSSMVADIVCSGDDSVWYELKKKVLSYHLCQYDIEMSREPTVFIRNIAAMLSKRYIFINETIRSDNITDRLLFGTHCSKYPMGCFKRLVVEPLRINLKFLPKVDLLIVLDAADECQTSDGRKDIVSVISQQLSQLPSQIKFVVTSRDLKSIRNQLTDFRFVSLHSFTNEIVDDLSSYFRYKTSDVRTHYIKFKMQELVNLSNGSFLFLKLYMENCFEGKICSIEKTPNSLYKLYRANLERVFGVNGGSFYAKAKGLFEVLCTTKQPLSLESMINMSGISEDLEIQTSKQFIRNEMGHFLHVSRDQFSLIHKSLIDFFLSLTPESPFYIDVKKGHQKIAQYYLENIKKSDMNFIDLAFHIANSFSFDLQSRFISLRGKTHFQENIHLLMHKVAEKVNSYRTANLISNFSRPQSMDNRNKNNETSAFVAAAHGNFETLKWLLEDGADINFAKDRLQYLKIPKYDLVEECKHVYFCGYNLLEIASQNGHTNTVILLLRKHINLQHKTLFGLTALDLAIENGHYEIIKHLLRSNQTYSPQYALFKASENGHISIVTLLLKQGLRDSCVSCNSSLYWLQSNEHRVQHTYFKVDDIFKTVTFSFIDDWQLIVCESALHAAVRNCHLDVIDVLTKENNNAIECVDRSGMTPILSSVKYNCSQGFMMLFKRGANNTFGCRQMFHISQQDVLSGMEKQKYKSYLCPEGAKIAHVVAMFYNFDILTFILKTNVSLFDVRDSEYRTPLHYGNCYKGSGLSNLVSHPNLRKHFDLNARSINGSTPYHAAAYCKSYDGHILSYYPDWLPKRQQHLILNKGIPDVLDNDGRSIIHYFFLGTLNSKLDFVFLRMYIENNLNFSRADKYGKNFLHYAVRSNSIQQIKYILDQIPVAERKEILMKKNIYGNTPLAEALNYIPHDPFVHKTHINQKVLRLPNCSLFEVFVLDCKANFTFLLEPAELINLNLILIYRENNISSVNVTELTYIAANKSSLYSILMIYTYYHSDFIDLVSDSKHVFNLMHLFRGPILGNVILHSRTLLECSKPFDSYPFSAIVMNYEDYFWTYSNNETFDHYLQNVTSSELDECFDSEGYNLLHRAAIGGNSFALQYLINKGMNISILSKQSESLLDLIVQHSFYSENGVYSKIHKKIESEFFVSYYSSDNLSIEDILAMNKPLSICNYDASANFVFSKIRHAHHWNQTYWKAKFCEPKTQKLSLVHLAAAKGLHEFISLVYDVFGRRVINCFNQHRISPYYLAHINYQWKLIKWFKEKQFKLKTPQDWTIPIIDYLYSVNFKRTINKPRNCRWSVLKSSKYITKSPYHFCFKVNLTSEAAHISLPYVGHFIYPTISIPNYFGQWIKRLWRFRYRAITLRRLLYDKCYGHQNYSQCSQMIKEVGLHLQRANRVSLFLYQNLHLFKGNHITYWASFVMMYKNSWPYNSFSSVNALFKIVLSNKLKYLNSLKMSDDAHKHWLFFKLSNIRFYDPLAHIFATRDIENMNTMFSQLLFR